MLYEVITYALSGYKNYREIEYVLTYFMFLGGMNFVLHYKFVKGQFKDFFGNRELQVYFFIVLFVTGLIVLNIFLINNGTGFKGEESFRKTVFTVVSILTTTGFGTEDINTLYFLV